MPSESTASTILEYNTHSYFGKTFISNGTYKADSGEASFIVPAHHNLYPCAHLVAACKSHQSEALSLSATITAWLALPLNLPSTKNTIASSPYLQSRQ